MTPDLPIVTRRLGVIGALCLLQVAGAVVAAIAVWIQIESIIAVGPLLATLGFVIATIALAIHSRGLLFYGLWHPLMTATFALAIAGFHWGPGDAQAPARVLVVANLFVLGPWCNVVLARPGFIPRRLPAKSHGVNLRFSLRGALVTTTVLCVLLAVAVSLTWRGEWPYFAMYALVMLALASLYLYAAHSAGPTPATGVP